MDESFQKFHGARFFTILDLRSGYWQILLDLMTRAKTAFSTRYGHYEWLVLPFGVSNGPGGFQKRMNKLLLEFIDKFVIVYMDDILIFSKNLHEHIGHIRQVLLALAGANMILNIEKCKFFQTETRFLGHILSRHGSRPDPRNIEKVMAWPTPRTITDVRGFCNLAGHYRRYIPKFADMSLPLTDLMKGSPAKGAKILWTGREEESFQQLKKALTSEPILRHPRMGQPFIIDPDSSQYCIGAVLQQSFQDPDGKTRLHPIAYESKKLTETEQRYATQEKELLAAKYALNHWRHFVEGSEIHIRTDHESLRVYRTKRPMTKRLGKFMNEIEHYDPMIEYRPGRLQVVPDALSHIPGAREDGDPADTDRFTLMALDEADDSGAEAPGAAATPSLATPVHRGGKPNIRHDSDYFIRVRRYLRAKRIEEEEEEKIRLGALEYVLKDGILYYKDTDIQVILEKEHLEKIVEAIHKDLGHYGKQQTLDALDKRFIVATDLWREGKKLLDMCKACQLFKLVSSTAETATIHPYGEQGAFDLWEMDFVGPLVTTKKGNKYLITAIDYATSKAFAIPLQERSAAAAVRLLERIVYDCGSPRQVITDNGEEFRGSEFQAAVKRHGIKYSHTTPGHPQSNGKVERLNHELVQRLQRIGADDGHSVNEWDTYLPQALLAFHAHQNSRTGCSSFYLQYGIEPRLLITSMLISPATSLEIAQAKHDRRTYVQDLSKHRTDAGKKYREALEKLVLNRDESAFAKDPIMPGDLVMRSLLSRKSKLHPRWDGPFVVIDSTEKDVYQLATASGYKLQHLVNVARLRKLSADERAKYVGDFWAASERLKLHDRIAHDQGQLSDVNKRLAEATTRQLEAQQQGRRADLSEIADISKEKRDLEASLKNAHEDTSTADPTPLSVASSPPTAVNSPPTVRHSERVRRAPQWLGES